MRNTRAVAVVVTLLIFSGFPACSVARPDPTLGACLKQCLPLLSKLDRLAAITNQVGEPIQEGSRVTVTFSTAAADAYVQKTARQWLEARACLVTYAKMHPDGEDVDDALFVAALASMALSQADVRHVPEAQDVLWSLWERRSTIRLEPSTQRFLRQAPSTRWLLDSFEAKRKTVSVPESEFVAGMLVAEYLKSQDREGAERAIKRFAQEGLATTVIEDLTRSLQLSEHDVSSTSQ